jgi:hypothetical protein
MPLRRQARRWATPQSFGDGRARTNDALPCLALPCAREHCTGWAVLWWAAHALLATCGVQRFHRLFPDNETFVWEIERSILNVGLAALGQPGSGGEGPNGTGGSHPARRDVDQGRC